MLSQPALNVHCINDLDTDYITRLRNAHHCMTSRGRQSAIHDPILDDLRIAKNRWLSFKIAGSGSEEFNEELKHVIDLLEVSVFIAEDVDDCSALNGRRKRDQPTGE